jgi:hypothetical protein
MNDQTPPAAPGLHEETARLLALDLDKSFEFRYELLSRLAAHLAAVDAKLKECEEELVSLDLSTKERDERLVEQRNEAEGEKDRLQRELTQQAIAKDGVIVQLRATIQEMTKQAALATGRKE